MLQKLLTMPILRGSELLHSFLTSQYEFTTGFLPDLNLGELGVLMVPRVGQDMATVASAMM